MLFWRLADLVQGRHAEQGLRNLPSPHTVQHAGPASAGRVSKQAVQLGSRFLTASDHTEETSEGALCAGRREAHGHRHAHPECCAGRGWAPTCSCFLKLICSPAPCC